jgi:hypothetical protein
MLLSLFLSIWQYISKLDKLVIFELISISTNEKSNTDLWNFIKWSLPNYRQYNAQEAYHMYSEKWRFYILST